ncbi:hypothetical protein V494_04415 [Pseudogymnoascus sp. VKM F-4513 (FW-928)]|nr:hypothetical protein V494_04415 [Pseudogymnoascus sp. VKM F-4513 (FW-928)]
MYGYMQWAYPAPAPVPAVHVSFLKGSQDSGSYCSSRGNLALQASFCQIGRRTTCAMFGLSAVQPNRYSLDFMPSNAPIPNAQDDPARPGSSGPLRRIASGKHAEGPMSGIRNVLSGFAAPSRQQTEASGQTDGPQLKRFKCSAYHLAWPTLHKYLVDKFPGCTIKELQLSKDWYIVDVPGLLTDEDLHAIDRLRTNSVAKRQSSRSPEL